MHFQLNGISSDWVKSPMVMYQKKSRPLLSLHVAMQNTIWIQLIESIILIRMMDLMTQILSKNTSDMVSKNVLL